MSPERAVQILESLVNGIHPLTRKALSKDSVCKEIGVSDALNCAITALNERIVMTRTLENVHRERPGVGEDDNAGVTDRPPEKAGKSWNPRDDAELPQLYKQGASVTQLAKRNKRTITAINARLVRHGFAEEQSEIMEAYSPDAYPIDSDEFRCRLLHGESIPELAKRYGRTEKAMRLRLLYIGLGGSGPNMIPKREENKNE